MYGKGVTNLIEFYELYGKDNKYYTSVCEYFDNGGLIVYYDETMDKLFIFINGYGFKYIDNI